MVVVAGERAAGAERLRMTLCVVCALLIEQRPTPPNAFAGDEKIKSSRKC